MGIWLDIWRALLAELDEKQYLNWEETFADGSFAGEKRGLFVGKTKRGKGTKWMVGVDGEGVPIGGTLASASPAEVKLIETTLECVKVPRPGRGRPRKRMRRLIADKGYDSDPLRKRLKAKKIDLICPHRRNRKKAKLQDARKLRRYPERERLQRLARPRVAGGDRREAR